jgi:uncharacterized membrane protein YeaQ/YmgE (transglycosylase-associated protein family)
MTIGKIIVWLVIGAFAGTLAGRLVTFSKQGLGFWTHLGVGMAGAVVGGFLGQFIGLGKVSSFDIGGILSPLSARSCCWSFGG